ncbi:hypothetical protein TSTA_031960 [Talaromyces stipitatus ATCC 10500]|uniref:Uncharacterized protein n=1 Tax=Talaromyces stipitatus (strain ATCC 10500 / CBS 375.48 / QM 6759 / NRRL 1006) TaxID=441959 RepID=B8M5P3_TALSN|nr:uncharacterized protein TSTA_031960 [Talaromyces stipitatus ATCC 10500]EED19937.1 hypothetical protein TSTA_031960 [Talaromyces stipitatus ATCC 10500]
MVETPAAVLLDLRHSSSGASGTNVITSNRTHDFYPSMKTKKATAATASMGVDSLLMGFQMNASGVIDKRAGSPKILGAAPPPVTLTDDTKRPFSVQNNTFVNRFSLSETAEIANTDKTAQFSVSDCENQQSTSATYLYFRIDDYNVNVNFGFILINLYNIYVDINRIRYDYYISRNNISYLTKRYSSSSSTDDYHARRFYFDLRLMIL